MIKKALSIIICTLILLMGVPFKSLAADTISQSNIKGVNYSVISVVPLNQQYQLNGNTYVQCVFTHRFEVVLDKEYLGYITGQLNGSYQAYNSTGTFTSYNAQSGSRSFYVAGNTFEYYVQTYAYMLVNQINNYSTTYSATFTYAGSNVIDISLIESLDDIQRAIETVDFHTEQITQYLYDSTNGSILEQVVTTNQLLVDAGQMFYNVMLTTDNINNNVEYLKALREFDIPLYSLGLVLPSFKYFDLYETMYNGSTRLNNYPIFIIPSGYTNNEFSKIWIPTNSKGYIIYGTTGGVGGFNSTTYKLNYTGSPSHTSTYIYNYWIEGMYMEVYKVQFTTGNTASTVTLQINNNTGSDLYFMPVMFLCPRDYQFPTDFSIEYGIPNSMVQNIENLANGTIQSDQAADDLIDDKDNLDDNMTDLFGIEDDYGNQLNNQLTNIDFTNPLQNNTSMLSSGNFVIQVFNGLIANNPLSILIIIVCILFVARRLFG